MESTSRGNNKCHILNYTINKICIEQNGLKEEREVENCEDAAQANQKRMNADPLEIMLMNMGYNFNAGINYGDQDDDDDDEHVVQCRPS